MKNNIMRNIVSFLIIQFILTFALKVNTAYADDPEVKTGKYIVSLYGTNSDYNDQGKHAKEYMNDSEFESQYDDMNPGTGGDWLYIGYKYTEDYSEAIRDVIAVVESETPNNTLTCNDIEYKIVPGTVGTRDTKRTNHGRYAVYSSKKVEAYNFNNGTTGTAVYLYTTTDPRAGSPIGAISVCRNSDKDGWRVVKSMDGNACDVNSSGDQVYLHIKDGELPDGYGSTVSKGRIMGIIGITLGVVLIGGVTVIFIKKKKVSIGIVEE